MSQPEQTELTEDRVFDLLSNERRRVILSYLDQHDGPVYVRDIAQHIAALENDVDPDEVTSKQQKRSYVSVYQRHIPKLADAGLVEYNDEERTVRLTSRVEELHRYLPTDDEQTPWHLYYTALAIVAGVTFALLQTDVISLGIAGETAALGVIIGWFILLSSIHLYKAHFVTKDKDISLSVDKDFNQ
ncbi:ArsR/SmtB family transcription factor [Haloarchaeobius sp. DFWS5]|uniref:ArsR/SmtB family transcription factor n=1 Tax=Haloarchaeobius sp. DFWS5 TaxID=3446114 RepID=UPI003EB9384E